MHELGATRCATAAIVSRPRRTSRSAAANVSAAIACSACSTVAALDRRSRPHRSAPSLFPAAPGNRPRRRGCAPLPELQCRPQPIRASLLSVGKGSSMVHARPLIVEPARTFAPGIALLDELAPEARRWRIRSASRRRSRATSAAVRACRRVPSAPMSHPHRRSGAPTHRTWQHSSRARAAPARMASPARPATTPPARRCAGAVRRR